MIGVLHLIRLNIHGLHDLLLVIPSQKLIHLVKTRLCSSTQEYSLLITLLVVLGQLESAISCREVG